MKLGQWLGVLAIVAAFYVRWQIRQLLLLVFTAIVLATALMAIPLTVVVKTWIEEAVCKDILDKWRKISASAVRKPVS